MAKKGKKVTMTSKGEIDDPKDEFLSLFVTNRKGEIKGESIGMEEEDIIIKQGDDFYRFPFGSVKLENDKLTITKRINWKKARKEGEKWRKRELDPLDQE